MDTAYSDGLSFIRASMERYNISLREISESVGVDRRTLRAALNGGQVTEARLEAVKRAVSFFRDRHGESIPMLGKIPAGVPFNVDDAVAEKYIAGYGLKSSTHFAVTVRGDSMAPDIQDGDYVILRKFDVRLPAKDDGPTSFDAVARFSGRVCAVLLNGESTLKRLEITRRNDDYQLILRPGNPAHPVRVIGPADELVIQGEMCRLIRNV